MSQTRQHLEPEEIVQRLQAVDALRARGYSERAACKEVFGPSSKQYTNYRYWDKKRRENNGQVVIKGKVFYLPTLGKSTPSPKQVIAAPATNGHGERMLVLSGPAEKMELIMKLARELGVRTMIGGKIEDSKSRE